MASQSSLILSGIWFLLPFLMLSVWGWGCADTFRARLNGRPNIYSTGQRWEVADNQARRRISYHICIRAPWIICITFTRFDWRKNDEYLSRYCLQICMLVGLHDLLYHSGHTGRQGCVLGRWGIQVMAMYISGIKTMSHYLDKLRWDDAWSPHFQHEVWGHKHPFPVG